MSPLRSIPAVSLLFFLAGPFSRGEPPPADAPTKGAEPTPLRHSEHVLSVRYSPCGKLIVSGGMNRPAKVWDAVTGAELRTLTGAVGWSLAISPDGKLIASGGADRLVHLWNLETGAELPALSGHDHSVWSVVFTPDGRLVSGGEDGTVRFWDVPAGGKEVRRLTAPGPVWSVA